MKKPSVSEHDLAQMTAAVMALQKIFPDNAVMVVVGFELSDGIAVCSAANISADQRRELIKILQDRMQEVPDNTPLH